MLSDEGEFLAWVDNKKLNWYVAKNLAQNVTKTSFELNFKPNGNGTKNRSEYYQEQLENQCVICGSKQALNMHHVVPKEFRKQFPISLKSRSNFDVLMCCESCHVGYEKHATKYKKELFRTNNLEHYPKLFQKLKSSVKTFYRSRWKLSPKRLEQLETFIRNNSKINLTNKEEALKAVNALETCSELLVSKIGSKGGLELFIVNWRKHFLKYAKPRFLAASWINDIELVERVGKN